MKELVLRTGTGIVYVIALLGAPLLGPWYFFGIYFTLSVFCVFEFLRLAKLDGANPLVIPTILVSVWPMVSRFLHYQLNWQIEWFGIYLFAVFLIVVAELFRHSKTPFQNISMSFMAMIYIGLSFSLLSELLYTAYTTEYSAYLLAFVLMIIWVHDSGAYIVGLLIGKSPLIKSISPKKTIEGLIGGIVLGGLAIWGFSFFIEIPTAHLWIIGFVVMVFSNFGDLFESKWKRHLGIKDSGKSLPGHGGWLDRLDSFLFVIPAVYFLILLLT